MEDGVHQPKPLLSIHGSGGNAQALEIVQNVDFHPLQPGLGLPQTVGLHAEGEVFCLGQAVVALGKLIFQHGGILPPHIVEAVPLARDRNTPAVLGGGEVQERKLKTDGAVEV